MCLNNYRSVDLSDDTIPPEIKIKPKQPTANDDSPENAPLAPSRPAPPLPPRTLLPDVVQENVVEAKKEIDQELLNMLLGEYLTLLESRLIENFVEIREAKGV